MISSSRFRAALSAAGVHFLVSALAALLVAMLVLSIYPNPYDSLAGGRNLVFLIIAIDVVCGPLLTLVLFDPRKKRGELWRDLGLVALIQTAAMCYGLWMVWQNRPLYLVHEVDRFKVITALDIDVGAISALPKNLQQRAWTGPITVAIRSPKSDQERKAVLFESILGGRDYAERPDFYIPYDHAAGIKALERAHPLAHFLEKHPQQQESVQKLASDKKIDFEKLFYVPVTGRQDWVAVLSSQGQIEGFLPGDGF